MNEQTRRGAEVEHSYFPALAANQKSRGNVPNASDVVWLVKILIRAGVPVVVDTAITVEDH